MERNVIQMLAVGLLLGSGTAPHATAQEDEDLLIFAGAVAGVQACMDGVEDCVDWVTRCVEPGEFNLCYVCYDFHGQSKSDIFNIPDPASLGDPEGVTQGTMRVEMEGYGFDTANKNTFGTHVVEYDGLGEASCGTE